MNSVGIPGLIFLLVVLVLIGLGVVSFALFIRRILLNQSNKNRQLHNIEQKLDEITTLLKSEK